MQDDSAAGKARNLLVEEFSQWRDQNKVSLALLGDSVCDDGRICLKLSLGRDKVFSLFCPSEYPSYEDNFFAESESVNHLWLNALNEYILDADGGLSLSSILRKANSLDSSVRYSPSLDSSEDEDENEEFMVLEEEDEEDQMERQLWDKEKMWRAKEAKLRAALKVADEPPAELDKNDSKKPKQVFSNSAASGILTNDLKHIIKTANDTGIDVEPIDSNIYEWSVRFSKFDPESKLQRDLNRLKENHGIGYIELQLEFTMDLYPFYPPVVRMVRPRPEGSVRFMLACLDILKLSSWNPTCGMISVLEEIKAYLAKHATLHVETAFRPSVLLPIENSLLQLALVSEVLPRDSTRYRTSLSSSSSSTSSTVTSTSASSNKSTVTSSSESSLTSSSSSSPSPSMAVPAIPSPSLPALPPASLTAPATPATSAATAPVPPLGPHSAAHAIMKKALGTFAKSSAKKQTFPDGTGYSTYADKGWDIDAYIAVEREKDKKIESVLQKILVDLRDYLRNQDCNSNLSAAGMDVAGSVNNEASPSWDASGTGSSSGPENGELDPASELGVSQSLSRSNSGSNISGRSAQNGQVVTDPVSSTASSFPWDPLRELYEALEASTLIPFIELKLQVDSFLEICQHKAVYRCVIDILTEIAARPWLARLLWKQPGQKKSIYSLLLCIKEKAQIVLDRYKMAAESTTQSKKKGKKRANSGSRDKEKTTRRSKVTTASSSTSASHYAEGAVAQAEHELNVPMLDIPPSPNNDTVPAPEEGSVSGFLLMPCPLGVPSTSAVLSSSGHTVSIHKFAFMKGKQDPSKSKSSSSATSAADAVKESEGSVTMSVTSGLSGFLSNIGITWPASWSMLNSDGDPPPIDMSTPLDPAGDEQLAQDFYDLAVKVERVINELGFPGSDSPEHSDEPLELRRLSVAAGTACLHDQELAAKYVAALKELQFGSCEIDTSAPSSHTYISSFTSALAPGRAQMMRISQELSSFSTSLPLDLASAIFVRSDDSKITLLKALIIGPEGTPYASGCFLFDIFFPSNYPKAPPKVTLRTTGRNSVRFNPNLYASGKVCLSLLGTWNGLQGEQWNETSTLLQVLVSIQSLIMVSEPYFNEPGYDAMLGTSEGKTASDAYNHAVKLNTVKLAMIEMLRYPPADFEDVVRTHFRIKGKRILQDLFDYMTLHPTLTDLNKPYKQLKAEIAKLKD